MATLAEQHWVPKLGIKVGSAPSVGNVPGDSAGLLLAKIGAAKTLGAGLHLERQWTVTMDGYKS